MVNLEKVREMFPDDKISYASISIEELSEIMENVDVSFEIDRDTLDYYYSIEIADLVESNVSDETLQKMADKGWSFDASGTELIIYLKNE